MNMMEANEGILQHQRKRKMVLKCLELEELLQEQGYKEEEIAEKVCIKCKSHKYLTNPANAKQWKKEQVSRCCTADVCLCQSVNQLYNNQTLPNLLFFPLLGSN